MSGIFVIMKKELRRFFTDTRMLVTVLLLPGLLVYVMYSVMGDAMGNMFTVEDDYVYRVGVAGDSDLLVHMNVDVPVTYWDTRTEKYTDTVNGESDPMILLQEGLLDLYVVFPDLLHMVHESSAAAYLMVADDKMFSAYAKLMNCYKPELPVLRKAEVPELVPMVMQRLCQWDKQELEHRQPVLMGYVNALVGELLSKLPLVERNTDQMLTHRLILYLLENYTRPITLEDVAKALGYSKYHISHVIAETFGCNFRTLINSYRISLAQSLLLAGDMTVGEAADACGFQNQSSFNRVFLQQCGVTPSAFRSRQGVKKDPPQIYIR